MPDGAPIAESLARTERLPLEVGDPPRSLIRWMREVEDERLAAERELGYSVPKDPLTASQIMALVTSLKDTLRTLAEAGPQAKATLYREFGIKLPPRAPTRLRRGRPVVSR